MLVMILLTAAFLLWLGYCFLVIYPAYRQAAWYAGLTSTGCLIPLGATLLLTFIVGGSAYGMLPAWIALGALCFHHLREAKKEHERRTAPVLDQDDMVSDPFAFGGDSHAHPF